MMTMMMTKGRCLILFFVFLPLAAIGQDKDFGIWYGVSAEHKLTDKIEIDLSTNIRTFNNAGKIEQVFIEGGLAYNFNKYIGIAGSYRLTKNLEGNNSYYFRHKWFLDLKGNLPLGNFNFSGRVRFQTGIKTYIADENDKFPYYTGRIKIKALYKTPSFPVNPYIYIESFFPLFSDKTRTIEKNRFSTGIEYSIAKKHSVELGYIFQRDYLPSPSDIHLISISYNFKF
jgi:hypothetical protein